MEIKSKVTIYDIAEALDLSPSTISRALCGYTTVRPDTCAKILKKARDLGYHQNLFASRLRTQNNIRVIGAAVSQFNSPLVSSILSGSEIMARQLGYNLLLRQSMNDPDLQIANIQNLGRSSVDGLLVTSVYVQQHTALQHALKNIDIPVVVIEEFLRLPAQTEKIIHENFKIAYQVTASLVNSGCRRIAFVSSNSSTSRHANVLNGYQQALRDNGAKVTSELMLMYDLESRVEICRELTTINPSPDGVVFVDEIIFSLSIPQSQRSRLKFAHTLDNKTLYERISLTRTDGLTTSDQHLILELGRIATCLLVCLIEEKNKHENVTFDGN